MFTAGWNIVIQMFEDVLEQPKPNTPRMDERVERPIGVPGVFENFHGSADLHVRKGAWTVWQL